MVDGILIVKAWSLAYAVIFYIIFDVRDEIRVLYCAARVDEMVSNIGACIFGNWFVLVTFF